VTRNARFDLISQIDNLDEAISLTGSILAFLPICAALTLLIIMAALLRRNVIDRVNSSFRQN